MQSIINDINARRSKPALLTTVALLGTLAGCAELTPYQVNISDTVLLCSSTPRPNRDDVTLQIEFEEEQPGVWCPKEPLEPCPAAFKGKKVTWEAVHKVDGSWEPATDARFAIYFSPFKATPAFKTTNDHLVTSTPIDLKTPKGVYKYTVWDNPQGNDPHLCDPLDPNLFVD
ncbi:hypothetical protein FV139_00105 [Parahaliea maris]|uniref:Lipoprotein n=1 Tax=Parahaliea maris TaxID=2716870 RepID=A0A5C9A7F4_9GAMM|nr:hypothetical protein [Parahaliea maris]TXS95952.1 hypothetical protein FV139_00105 [Parahaliea maris]